MKAIVDDWKWLVDTFKIKEDSRYLHQDGKPIVTVWGTVGCRLIDKKRARRLMIVAPLLYTTRLFRAP